MRLLKCVPEKLLINRKFTWPKILNLILYGIWRSRLLLKILGLSFLSCLACIFVGLFLLNCLIDKFRPVQLFLLSSPSPSPKSQIQSSKVQRKGTGTLAYTTYKHLGHPPIAFITVKPVHCSIRKRHSMTLYDLP